MPDKILAKLLQMTTHSNHSVKCAAILALGDGAPKTDAVVERLLTLTSHSNYEVKGAAARALGTLYSR